MKISERAYKIIFPHAFILLAALLFGLVIFQAMMDTNNNGEFGYPDQGIYLWGEILPIVLTGMAIPIVLLEGVFVLYKLFIKYLLKKAKPLN
jgi:hypothetical protein